MTFIASLFGIFYEEFSSFQHSFEGNLDIRTKSSCPTLNLKEIPSIEKENRYLEPLKKLQKYGEDKLSRHVLGFYLHGSFATRDYVKNWSDVDTLLVLKKETLRDVDRLIKFQKSVYRATGYFYLIDPSQSHGFFVFSEYDISYYPETYFPLELFKYSRSFLSKDLPLSFEIRRNDVEKMELFWRDVVHYTRRMLVKSPKRKSLNNNNIRMLLHRIYIFPAFYLQAKGIQCYKKFSFDLAQRYFTEEEWQPVAIANRVWRKWEVNYYYRFIPQSVFCLSPFATSFCLKRFYNLKKSLFSKYHIDYWKLLIESNRLFETAWDRLPKRESIEELY